MKKQEVEVGDIIHTYISYDNQRLGLVVYIEEDYDRNNTYYFYSLEDATQKGLDFNSFKGWSSSKFKKVYYSEDDILIGIIEKKNSKVEK